MSSFSKSSSSSSSKDEYVVELRRGPWTMEEDNILVRYIACHGEGRWNNLANCSGLKRNGKSCRLRWLNYLKPDVKRGNLTLQEQLLILELHSKWGNRWSKIAQHLPGRTDNEIKNYWRTRVQKQAKHLNIDSNSPKFKEIIRFLWMPRLLEKIHRSSPATATNHPSPQFHPQKLGNLDNDHTSSSSSELSADCSLNQLTQFEQVSQVLSESPISLFNADDYDMYANMESADVNVGRWIEPMLDSQRETKTWIHEVEDSFWNMDELWELQETQN